MGGGGSDALFFPLRPCKREWIERFCCRNKSDRLIRPPPPVWQAASRQTNCCSRHGLNIWAKIAFPRVIPASRSEPSARRTHWTALQQREKSPAVDLCSESWWSQGKGAEDGGLGLASGGPRAHSLSHKKQNKRKNTPQHARHLSPASCGSGKFR